jgi:iron transport multicopper oxidase
MATQTDVEALPVDMLSLAAAQRYSVLVTARNETTQNYLFHANFEPSMFDRIPDALKLSTSNCSRRSQQTNVENDRETEDEFPHVKKITALRLYTPLEHPPHRKNCLRSIKRWTI